MLGVVAVVLLALGAFSAGVGTASIPDIGSESVLGWLYFTGGLFVFGGLDLGTPLGGPPIARAALWVSYFLAPAITTTAIAKTMLMMVRQDSTARRRLNDHVILIGSSGAANAYAEAIHQSDSSRLILRVDHQADLEPSFDEARFGRRLPLLRGDVRFAKTLEVAGLSKAFRVIFFTDSDLVNLKGAWSSLHHFPEIPVAAHVTDSALLRPVNRLLRSQRQQVGNSPVPLVFSTHRIGALHLYEQFIHPYFESTGYRDVVVIAGFGHYSQTILELLCAMAEEELDQIIIVDRAAAKAFRQLRSDVDIGQLDISTVDGELEDPDTWLRCREKINMGSATPLFLLNSADESVNYKVAMLLRAQSLKSKIFLCCFHNTVFAQSLSLELNVEVIATEELLSQALCDHYEALTSVKS